MCDGRFSCPAQQPNQIPPRPGTLTQVLARIEEAIQPHPYFAFFRDTVLVSDDAVIIRVRVRSSDAGEWIAKHHADALRETLAGVRVRGCRY
jgi:hypothetical protein